MKSNLFFLAAIILTGYQCCINLPEAENIKEVLPNNIQLSNKYYFENTAKVIPANAKTPFGSIVVSTGNTSNLLQKKLYDSAGNIDLSMSAVNNFPTLDSAMIGTDNQIIRLADGTLLCMRASSIWTKLPGSSYQNTFVCGERGTMERGLRDCIHFFHSVDGGITWNVYSEIDFGHILNGKYGYPQANTNPECNSIYWQGGGDREEIYLCPFTNNLYLSTRIICGVSGSPEHKDINVVFWSKDMGLNWQLLTENIPAWSPLVMTSTPDGRLFLFHVIGQTPTIYFTTTTVTSNSTPQISQGYSVYYTENRQNIISAADNSNMIPIKISTPSISRIGFDHNCSKVRVAYQALNASGRQVAKIIRIVVKDPMQPPLISPIATVEAGSKDYSVMHFTFIDPDYIDMPKGYESNKSVLYWVESPYNGFASPGFSAKYATIEGDFNVSPSAHLSLHNDMPRTWRTTADPSHYMTGGFFWSKNTLNYFCQWAEPNGLFGNIVSMRYQPPSSPKDPDECATIQKVIRQKEKIIAGLSHSNKKEGTYNNFLADLRREIAVLKEKKKKLGCYLS